MKVENTVAHKEKYQTIQIYSIYPILCKKLVVREGKLDNMAFITVEETVRTGRFTIFTLNSRIIET